MKIQLNDNEIKTALIEYVSSQGIDISGKAVEVDMVAGRKDNGFSATIDITDAGEPASETTVTEGDTEQPADAKQLFGVSSAE